MYNRYQLQSVQLQCTSMPKGKDNSISEAVVQATREACDNGRSQQRLNCQICEQETFASSLPLLVVRKVNSF